jgi:hypothetical protein
MSVEKMEEEDMTNETKQVPDEQGGIQVEGHIRIFDPETGEDFVNKRNSL